MKKTIAVGLSVLASMGFYAAPAAADEFSRTSTTEVTNTNSATVTNSISITANTGNNTANGGDGATGGTGGAATASASSDAEGSTSATGGDGGDGGSGGRGGVITTGSARVNVRIQNEVNHNMTSFGSRGSVDLEGSDVDDVEIDETMTVENNNDATVVNDVDFTANTGENVGNGGDGARGGNGGNAEAEGGEDDDNDASATGGNGGMGGNGGDGAFITTGNSQADIDIVNEVNHNETGPDVDGDDDGDNFGDDVDDVVIDEDENVTNNNEGFVENMVSGSHETGNNTANGGDGATGGSGGEAMATGSEDDETTSDATGGDGGNGGNGGSDGDILTGDSSTRVRIVTIENHNITRISRR